MSVNVNNNPACLHHISHSLNLWVCTWKEHEASEMIQRRPRMLKSSRIIPSGPYRSNSKEERLPPFSCMQG